MDGMTAEPSLELPPGVTLGKRTGGVILPDGWLAIVGTRELEGDRRVIALLRRILRAYRPARVISGGARGVDALARVVCDDMRVPCFEEKPRVESWDADGGYRERNIRIAEACEALIRICHPHPRTYGSGFTRDQAAALGKPTREFIVGPLPRGAEGWR